MGKAKMEWQEYKTSSIVTNEDEIHRSLLNDLIAKINGCTYITRIVTQNNYDGTMTVTVTYENGVRSIYTVEY